MGGRPEAIAFGVAALPVVLVVMVRAGEVPRKPPASSSWPPGRLRANGLSIWGGEQSLAPWPIRMWGDPCGLPCRIWIQVGGVGHICRPPRGPDPSEVPIPLRLVGHQADWLTGDRDVEERVSVIRRQLLWHKRLNRQCKCVFWTFHDVSVEAKRRKILRGRRLGAAYRLNDRANEAKHVGLV